LNIQIFLSIILALGIFSLFYLQQEEIQVVTEVQIPDIVFKTTNASADSFSEHHFNQ
jgi:hypothetical protein